MSTTRVPDLSELSEQERHSQRTYYGILHCFSEDPERWWNYNDLQTRRLEIITRNRNLRDYTSDIRGVINRWNKTSKANRDGLIHGPSTSGDGSLYDGCHLVNVHHRVCLKKSVRREGILVGKYPFLARIEPEFARRIFKEPEDVIEGIDHLLTAEHLKRSTKNRGAKRTTVTRVAPVKGGKNKKRKTIQNDSVSTVGDLLTLTTESAHTQVMLPSPSPDYEQNPVRVIDLDLDSPVSNDEREEVDVDPLPPAPTAHLHDNDTDGCFPDSNLGIFGFGELTEGEHPPSAIIPAQPMSLDTFLASAAVETLQTIRWPIDIVGGDHWDETWSQPLTHAPEDDCNVLYHEDDAEMFPDLSCFEPINEAFQYQMPMVGLMEACSDEVCCVPKLILYLRA